jgi:NAD(P)-dependent dehydrogenase (short-subunit alcohol dehydrogenase family)
MQKMKANVTANSVHPGIVKTRITRDRDGLITGDDHDMFISALRFVFSVLEASLQLNIRKN